MRSCAREATVWILPPSFLCSLLFGLSTIPLTVMLPMSRRVSLSSDVDPCGRGAVSQMHKSPNLSPSGDTSETPA